jgi:hypothetical protein
MTTDTEQLAADIKRVMELDARHKKERSKWYAESHLCLQADIIRQLTDIVRVQHEALEHAAHWRPFGEAIARHIDGSACPVQVALALSAPLVKEV